MGVSEVNSGISVMGCLLLLSLPLCGLLSLILGLVALVRINRSNGALRGRGLAIGAIILGSLLFLSTALVALGGLNMRARRAENMEMHEMQQRAMQHREEASRKSGTASVTIHVVAPGVFEVDGTQMTDVKALEDHLRGRPELGIPRSPDLCLRSRRDPRPSGRGFPWEW